VRTYWKLSWLLRGLVVVGLLGLLLVESPTLAMASAMSRELASMVIVLLAANGPVLFTAALAGDVVVALLVGMTERDGTGGRLRTVLLVLGADLSVAVAVGVVFFGGARFLN